MAGEPDENVGLAAAAAAAAVAESSAMAAIEEEKPKDEKVVSKEASKQKKRKGILSTIWNGIFRSSKDDFERRLERISKEEAAILTRMRRRAQTWGRMKRNLILLSLLLELVAVGFAIMTARTAENWKDRAFRVLPMFLLPALSSILYSALMSLTNMRERKDQKTLEKLRAERQAKIDELKEKTNYYITQQLIQRYDTDPAAKAAAATVLASKLGADSGLKVFLGDESNKLNVPSGKSSDVELVQSTGLRNRKQPQSRATSPGGTIMHNSAESSPHAGGEYTEHIQPHFVDHYQGQGGATAYNNGWLSRIAALLVGEDPTQCYALICGNCHMHNGLASKEDFPYVTYICPHCHAVNGPKIQQDRGASGTATPNVGSHAVNGPKIQQERSASGTATPNVGSTISTDHGNAIASSTAAVDSPRDNPVDNSKVEAAPLAATEASDKTEVAAAADES